MATYEERRAARQARLDARADRKSAEATARFKAADAAVAGIPFGQPILVGHHSERRHRRDLARQRANMDAGVEASREAERISSITPTTAILVTDSDAVEQMEAKLAKAEALQAKMVAANKLIRKKDITGLVAMFGESVAAELLKPDFAGRIGFAQYQLSNNNANIRTMRGRLADLKAAQAAPALTRTVGEVTVSEDPDDQRIRLIYPGKPDPATIAKLKRHGFRWSPSNRAWQRQLNAAGRYAAKCVLGEV